GCLVVDAAGNHDALHQLDVRLYGSQEPRTGHLYPPSNEAPCLGSTYVEPVFLGLAHPRQPVAAICVGPARHASRFPFRPGHWVAGYRLAHCPLDDSRRLDHVLERQAVKRWWSVAASAEILKNCLVDRLAVETFARDDEDNALGQRRMFNFQTDESADA